MNHPSALTDYATRVSRLSNILNIDKNTTKSLFVESTHVWKLINERTKKFSTFPFISFPRLQILYTAVRVLKPTLMVETGVSSGSSSFAILSAMEKNGSGKLHSIDIGIKNNTFFPEGTNIGWVVPENYHSNWKLIIGDVRLELPKLLESLKEIDVFYHDSDHSYDHMVFELNHAFSFIKNDGVIIADDIQLNFSFDEFVKKNNLSSAKFYGFGIARRGI